MTYHGLRSWPPVWTWVGGANNQRPKGEVGILKEARVSKIEPADRIFLYMEYEKASYIGCLLIDHVPSVAKSRNYCKSAVSDPSARLAIKISPIRFKISTASPYECSIFEVPLSPLPSTLLCRSASSGTCPRLPGQPSRLSAPCHSRISR
jgi:hypothetical protein